MKNEIRDLSIQRRTCENSTILLEEIREPPLCRQRLGGYLLILSVICVFIQGRTPELSSGEPPVLSLSPSSSGAWLSPFPVLLPITGMGNSPSQPLGVSLLENWTLSGKTKNANRLGTNSSLEQHLEEGVYDFLWPSTLWQSSSHLLSFYVLSAQLWRSMSSLSYPNNFPLFFCLI